MRAPATTMKGTALSRELCEHIRARSGSTCLLGFSRGKDSIAAWLWLRQFFDRVIPFHSAAVPHLRFVDESLAYYERVFRTPIERCLSGYCTAGMMQLMYQPIEDYDALMELDLWQFNNNETADLLRAKHNVPEAWCAYGISSSDSIHRYARIKGLRSKKAEGDKFAGCLHENVRSFYPCVDWTGEMVLEAIRKAKISLPRDYHLACRSFGTVVPNNRHLDRMLREMPEDFARVELMFPLIRACVARNEFRRMRHGK